MDDEFTRPAQPDDLTGRTSDRVAGMSDEERAELARDLARRTASVPDTPARRAPDAPDPAAAAVRLTAELHRTERRLDRLDRSISHSRYQIGSGSASGRYARLVSRARRLERQLRSFR
jgi:hypothetical protein